MKPKRWWDKMVMVPNGCIWQRRQIAEQLMANVRPFGLLSEAEKEVMRECEVESYSVTGWDGKWYEHSFGRNPATSYRVRADFVPVYEESRPQLDPNEAQEGYVAVEGVLGDCCKHCDLGRVSACSINSCRPHTRKDKCEVYFVKKPSEWGEWQECELTNNDRSVFAITKIRFKKGK